MKVLPHERFRLVDDDVHLDVPLTLRQALLGTEVMIPTLEGRRSDGSFRGPTLFGKGTGSGPSFDRRGEGGWMPLFGT